LRFLALGAAESKGLRKGLIVNLDSTVSSIRRAVEEAEGVANVPVESAGDWGGWEPRAGRQQSRGGISLGNRARDIERDDVRRAIDTARKHRHAEDREVLHVLPHEFLVDAQDGIRDPIGMIGQRLEANVHVVTSSMAATQNLITAANKAGILINDTVLEPLASAEACLMPDEKEMGCCILDIGGGTTEFWLFSAAAWCATRELSLSAATTLRMTWRSASAHRPRSGEDQASPRVRMGRDSSQRWSHRNCQRGRPSATHYFCPQPNRDYRAARARVAGDDSRRPRAAREWNGQIQAGFVLTGGGAQLNGFDELAEHVFQLPVRIGGATRILDMPESVARPDYATVVGLVLHAAKTRRTNSQKANNIVSRLKSMFAGA